MIELKDFIRDVPDFPKPGIVFKDITPLLQDARAWAQAIEQMQQRAQALQADLLLGIESRGFLFAGALAKQLGRGLIIARKPGKLPYRSDEVSYDLEYGSNTLQMHVDAVKPGQRVIIVDDLLATGGTAAACSQLVGKQRGVVAGYLFCVELSFLQGRRQLGDAPVESLLQY